MGVIETLDAVSDVLDRTFRFARLLGGILLVAGGIVMAWIGFDRDIAGLVAGGAGMVVGGIVWIVVTLGEYRADRLARRGAQVQATVIGIRDTGWRQGDEFTEGEPFWAMSFDLGGGRRARCMQDLHPAARRELRPGGPVVLRVSRRGRRVMVDCPATLAWLGGAIDARWRPDRVHRPWRDVAPGRKERTTFSGVAVVLGTLMLVAGAVCLGLGARETGEVRTGLFVTGATLAGIAAFWLLIVVLMRFFGRTPADAVPARSQVLGTHRTGTMINDRRVVKVQLRSQLQDGRSFDHEARIPVPSVVIDRLVPGTWIVGHISPTKPSKVRVDWPQTTAWLDSGR